MTAQPTWEPTDQADLLALVADPERIVGSDAVTAFLDACENDARTNGGIVSVNRVSAALTEAGIQPQRYSSFWGHFTGAGKPMRKATTKDTPMPFEVRRGSTSGNDGKPMKLRVWVGAL